MEIKISIEKKYAWMLLFAVLAVGFVIAYGGNNPQEVGHSLGEVEGLDNNNDGVVDMSYDSYRIGGKLLAELPGANIKAKWLFVNIHDRNALNNANAGANQGKTVKEAADFCIGGSGYRAENAYGCCRSALLSLCKVQGYSSLMEISTCGTGWCSGNQNCQHGVYCIDIPPSALP